MVDSIKIKSEYDLYQKYSSEEKREELFADYLLPNDIECPFCHYKNSNKSRIKIFPDRSKVRIKCAACGNEFNIFVDWFFKKNKIEYGKWLMAFYRILRETGSISAARLRKNIGVQYTTARSMLLKLGKILEQDITLSGEVEIDETYVKPDPTRMHKKRMRSKKMKKSIFGILERKNPTINSDHTRIALQYVRLPQGRNISRNKAKDLINQFVDKKAQVTFFTDGAKIYKTDTDEENTKQTGITAKKRKPNDIFSGRRHEVVVHHGELQKWLSWPSHRYVWETKDNVVVTTNRIENVFKHLKAMLCNTFVSLDKKYIQYYINIFCFYWNNKDIDLEEWLFKLLDCLKDAKYQKYTVDKVTKKQQQIQKIKQKNKADREDKYKELKKQLRKFPDDMQWFRLLFLWNYEEMLKTTWEKYRKYVPYDGELEENYENDLAEIKENLSDPVRGPMYKMIYDELQEIIQNNKHSKDQFFEIVRRKKIGMEIKDQMIEKRERQEKKKEKLKKQREKDKIKEQKLAKNSDKNISKKTKKNPKKSLSSNKK
jgi:hypothetical protein